MLEISKIIKKEQDKIRPIVIFYKSKYILSMFPFDEIIHIPLYYGSFYDLHMKMKPNI